MAPSQAKRPEPFPVRLVVGVENLHQMQIFHYTDWISLSIGAVRVEVASIASIFCQPVALFEPTLARSTVLRAQQHCNLHGIWESEFVEVEVA